MGAESRLRQRHRTVIRAAYPNALIVGQPANGYTGPGRHDIYVIVDGRFVGLELKTGKGRATPVQLDRIRQTRRSGGWAWVVRTPNQSLGAIHIALKGIRMPDNSSFDFDSLFGETPTPLTDTSPEGLKAAGATGEEISAFLQEVGTVVEPNGQAPTQEGSAIEVPDDYSMAEVVSLQREVAISVAQLHTKLDAIMQAAGVEVQAPQPVAPPKRQRRTK